MADKFIVAVVGEMRMPTEAAAIARANAMKAQFEGTAGGAHEREGHKITWKKIDLVAATGDLETPIEGEDGQETEV